MIGTLIRNERIKQKLSLESLSLDICSPSYLSKIENNSVFAHEEIIQLLLEKLNIDNVYEVSDEIKYNLYNTIDVFFLYDDFESIQSFYLDHSDLKHSEMSMIYYLIEIIYLLGMGNLKGDHFERVTKLTANNNTDNYYLNLTLGLLYLNFNQLYLAKKSFQECIKYNTNGLGEYGLAQCLYQQEDYFESFYILNRLYKYQLNYGNLKLCERIGLQIIDILSLKGEINSLNRFIEDEGRVIEYVG